MRFHFVMFNFIAEHGLPRLSSISLVSITNSFVLNNLFPRNSQHRRTLCTPLRPLN